MDISRPRGTRDFLFAEMRNRKEVEGVLRRTFETYGYHEIKTPIFEELKLFTVKSGEEVVNQIYHFTDKGGRELALRPELTAPVARLYMNEMQKKPKPIKMYYFGSCFRYERPQAGRFRQFWQFGCELIGGSSPLAEAEVISLASRSLHELGLDGFEVHIGHLGILRGILGREEISPGLQDRIMGVIDKGDVEELEALLGEVEVSGESRELLMKLIGTQGGPEVLDEVEEYLGGYSESLEALEEFRKLVETLHYFGVEDYHVNLGIARGLDYYTGIVFEIYVPELGAQKQICGGGTYNLVETFGGERVESTGFAFGFDRLMNALGMDEENMRMVDVFVIPIQDSTVPEAIRITQELRAAGVSADLELAGRKLRKALSHADNLGARFAVLTGERELQEGKVTVKDMERNSQETLPRDEMVDKIKGRC
ncbi:histidine--tRNA ligase [Methanothermobacter thermautotrophicus]|uniref:Histidine--tRNA ligase n=1 Tax=Methanothermobacter thermautotrophicus TaxID=145262 RepID=A0A842YJH9_METTF|nr:histidine--tRNA ligase [Methanothermobacter thermautotrophicus]MBE2899439.1 histidine--tRNA ligase [Methanothermobacter thermautotrophicus]MCQ8904221.1 histidine--tRNA ligase [Methanothermobacter sp.]